MYFLTWRVSLILDCFYFSVIKRKHNEFLSYVVDLLMIPLLKEGISPHWWDMKH